MPYTPSLLQPEHVHWPDHPHSGAHAMPAINESYMITQRYSFRKEQPVPSLSHLKFTCSLIPFLLEEGMMSFYYWFIFAFNKCLEIRASRYCIIAGGSCYSDPWWKWRLCPCVDAALRKVFWEAMPVPTSSKSSFRDTPWLPAWVYSWHEASGCAGRSRVVKWVLGVLDMKSEKLDLNFNSPTHYLCNLGQFSPCLWLYSAVFAKILFPFPLWASVSSLWCIIMLHPLVLGTLIMHN